MAAVLLALTMWVLACRRERVRAGTLRGGARDPVIWLVPIAWIWTNAHASYFLAFVLLGVHALDLVTRRGRASLGATLRPIAIGGLAMLAISFLNPFGWRTLWQPFDYALHLSKEPLFQGIGELQPMSWSTNLRNGAWLMIVVWPALALLRARREGWDLAELLTLALASAYAIPSQRFLGVYALAAAPYLARDLDAWVRSRPWPRWTARPAARGALAATACVLIELPEAGRPRLVPGIGIELSRFPVAACDFMAAHGVRGHGFSDFRSVGYQTWRFWPDRERLPFTDIHQSGSPEDRLAFAAAFVNPTVAWPALVQRYRLDYAVLDRRVGTGAALLEVVDADTGWSMVFLDDAAGLYVRRKSLAAVADSFGYRFLGAGTGRMALLAQRMAADSTVIDSARRELERSAAGSRWNARAHSYLASLALVRGRTDEAEAHLRQVLAISPDYEGAHRDLGLVKLMAHQPRDAAREFEREESLHGPAPGLEMGEGLAWEAMGDSRRAIEHFRRELRRDPANTEARARLDSLMNRR